MIGCMRAVGAAFALAVVLCSAPAAHASRLLDVTPDVGSRARPPASAVLSVGGSPFARTARVPIAHIADLQYEGGQVLHSNRTHAIFWEPAGSGMAFPPGYETLVEQFLQNVAADSHLPTNTYSLSGQYSDSAGPAAYSSTYDGAVVATDPLPHTTCAEPLIDGPGWSVCIDDNEIQNEIEQVIASDNLKTGPNDIYFLITPPGLGSCQSTGPADCALGGKNPGSYCGYHSVTNNSRYLYAVIPYNAEPGHCQSTNPRPNNNPVDPSLSTISHEQNEVVTDPYGDAWVNSNGNEAADLCITSYGPSLGGSGAGAYNEVIGGGHYYLQELYSNWGHACAPRAQPDTVSFSISGTPTVGRPIAFTAHGAAAHGRITSYLWSFGANDTGHGAHPKPVLTKPGRYVVTLRSTDSADLWTFARRTMFVRPY